MTNSFTQMSGEKTLAFYPADAQRKNRQQAGLKRVKTNLFRVTFPEPINRDHFGQKLIVTSYSLTVRLLLCSLQELDQYDKPETQQCFFCRNLGPNTAYSAPNLIYARPRRLLKPDHLFNVRRHPGTQHGV